ncbi:MAG: glycoside hydrolase family 5 protein [Candidatus Shapirobacteria bacterium]|nr:glycoside hydrolase family 5 protein [Candidatus Shapirobacteria bacterium]MDD5074032.1 glycoside hydrolase family 5 protein [Candidatus Shapirobacteria bacterium]MDD5481587.1 glycoside hydrolase family 5 protein [Candidatus Shapirobacteria bacterium]
MIFKKPTPKTKKRLKLLRPKRVGLSIIYFLPLLIIAGLILRSNWPQSYWTNPFLKEASPKQKEENQLPWLSTSGRFIINEDGVPVVLRGVNLSSVSWGYHDWFPKAVKIAIDDWKANVIRTRVYQDDYFANPESFFALMEKTIIGPAREKGAYVILNPWIGKNEPLPNDQTFIFWQEIARHYQDDPTIIYDVLAEPHDVSRTQVWEANQKLIEAIRQVHPKSLIMVTGTGWGREINSYLDNPLPYKNIVYRTNPYNKAGEFEAIFGQIARFYPVFLGEFGADGYPPMSQESVGELLSLANRFSLGWTAWNFHSVGCPCLLSDHQTYQSSTYGQIVKDSLSLPLTINQNELEPKYIDKKLIIYSDYLENNFRDLSWDAEINLVDQKEPNSSQKSIKVSFNEKYGAFYLSSYLPHRLDPHQNLVLQINTPSLTGFTVGLVDDQGKQLAEQAIEQFGQAKNSGWYQVDIPLSILNSDNKPVSGLLIKNPKNNSIPFWLDNLYFE